MPEQRNTLGILGDIPRFRVIDEKGRDSRRELDRFNDLLEYYRAQVIIPENPQLH
jgi:hypothetical protein